MAISGNATTAEGLPVDYVRIFSWPDRLMVGAIRPDENGDWSFSVSVSGEYGITYIANGCQPVTHGPYYFEAQGDTYFSNVSLLMHFEGVHGTFSFTDTANENRVWSKTGSPIIDHGQAMFGLSAGYFNGQSSIQMPHPSDWDTTEPITFELYIRPETITSGSYGIFGNRFYGGGRNHGFQLNLDYTGGISFVNWNNSNTASTSSTAGPSSRTVDFEQWNHIALVHTGNNVWFLFINGEQVATVTGLVNDNQGPFILGSNRTDEKTFFKGYIDEFRVTPGIARYTTDFLPPTEPFPDSAEG